MSQMNENTLQHGNATMEKDNTYHELQQDLDHVSALTFQHSLYHHITDCYSPKALAVLLKSKLRQINLYSPFDNDRCDSDIFICHSNTPRHYYGSLNPRTHQIATASGTEGLLGLVPTTRLQKHSRIELDDLWWLSGIPPVLPTPTQTFPMTKLSASQQNCVLDQNPRSCVILRFAPPIFTLAQLSSTHAGSSLMQMNSQRAWIKEGSNQDRGRRRARRGLGSRFSLTPFRFEIRSTSKSSEAELNIINSYASPSEGPGSRAGTRPTSLTSLYGCALVNEEDYVAENPSDREDNDWDDCGMSLSKS